jgi:hypothetical protein
MAGVTVERTAALIDHFQTMSAYAGEGRDLFYELLKIDQRQEKWTKASKFASIAAALVAFFVEDFQDLRTFPYEPLILGFVLSQIAFFGIMLGANALGRSFMRPQVEDWAERADRVVRECGKAAS